MDYEALIEQTIKDTQVELWLFSVVGVLGILASLAAFFGLAHRETLDVLTKGAATLAPNFVSGFSATRLLSARSRIGTLRFLRSQIANLHALDEDTRSELEDMLLDMLRTRLKAKEA